jgi:hypothetical protein
METVTYRLTGTCPLLMHNERLANPFDPIVREMKKITAKKNKKTDEDTEALYRLEWEGGLYFDEKLGPYLPGWNIHKAIVEAAKLTRHGKDIDRGVQVMDGKAKLLYDGPRKVEAMFNDGRFIDVRGVKVGKAKPMRARPKFEAWACEFTVAVDTATINVEEVTRIINDAGSKTGIGDFRQRYGRFTAEVV